MGPAPTLLPVLALPKRPAVGAALPLLIVCLSVCWSCRARTDYCTLSRFAALTVDGIAWPVGEYELELDFGGAFKRV